MWIDEFVKNINITGFNGFAVYCQCKLDYYVSAYEPMDKSNNFHGLFVVFPLIDIKINYITTNGRPIITMFRPYAYVG